MSDRDDLRYGVFLTPDAATSAAVTTITGFVRAQFGLVSAGAFPPHITLVGSLPLATGEDELVATVARAVQDQSAFDVHNAGVSLLGESVVYDVHTLNGGPNLSLLALLERLNAALRPLLRPSAGLPPDLREPEEWRGHLSLASHELNGQPLLRAEVEDFIRQLAVPYPSRFRTGKVTIYRLRHATWIGDWWTTFQWQWLSAVSLGAS